MNPAPLELANHLIDPLQWVVARLDTWIGRHTYRMGGGSVLAARWGHRHSSDIDLFFDEFVQRDLPLSDMFDGLLSLEEKGEIHGLELYSRRGFLFQRKAVPVSFFATRETTPSPLSEEKEATTGIATESSAEILLKKVRARMLRGSGYLFRDAYDLVVAHAEDAASIGSVFNQIGREERSILSYDSESASFQLIDDQRVLSPAYPELIEPIENLIQLTREALAGRLSRDRVLAFKRLQPD